MSIKPFAVQGWKRRGFAALLGAFATAALPPFFILPLLIPSFSGLLLLVAHAKSRKQSFADGWWWGLGHFTTGLYWICISLFVEPDKYAWLTPLALFGLPSVLGIYTGLAALLLFVVKNRIARFASPLPALPWAFALIWVGVEYLRAHLFTGFPWNLIGYSFNATDITLQTAAVWGIYGQSLMAVLLGALPALLLYPQSRRILIYSVELLLLGGIIAFGTWRLEHFPTEYTTTRLRIVQANVPQSMKFNPDTMLKGMVKHIDLMRSPGFESVDIAIWPETAVPFLLTPHSKLTHDLGLAIGDHALLISGGMRAEGEGESWRGWNGAFMLNGKGDIVAQYDKHHLVPFGEYIPFRDYLPLKAIAVDIGDFTTGPGPATLTPAPYPPFSPLVCYEAIFPEEAIDQSNPPRWLVNITNDAWFGISSGPYQHMEMARARAVETGLPLVRAANTGISIITDGYGRKLKLLSLQSEAVLDSLLPNPALPNSIPSRLLILVSHLLIGIMGFLSIRYTEKA